MEERSTAYCKADPDVTKSESGHEIAKNKSGVAPVPGKPRHLFGQLSNRLECHHQVGLEQVVLPDIPQLQILVNRRRGQLTVDRVRVDISQS